MTDYCCCYRYYYCHRHRYLCLYYAAAAAATAAAAAAAAAAAVLVIVILIVIIVYIVPLSPIALRCAYWRGKRVANTGSLRWQPGRLDHYQFSIILYHIFSIITLYHYHIGRELASTESFAVAHALRNQEQTSFTTPAAATATTTTYNNNNKNNDNNNNTATLLLILRAAQPNPDGVCAAHSPGAHPL